MGFSWDHVGARAARDDSYVAGRLAEEIVRRPTALAHISEHVQQSFNSRLSMLRISRMGRAPYCLEPHPQRAFRANGESVVCRLSVNQILALRGERVRVGRA